VALAAARRTVSVEEGEALLAVAKDARRPFVVQVADREVVALGTEFSVRLTPTSEIDTWPCTGQVSVYRLASRSLDWAPAMRPAGS